MVSKEKNKQNKGFFSFSIDFTGILTAGGAIICTASVLGFFGEWFWFFDLFSHFLVQYALSLTLLALLFLVFRELKTAIVFLCFASLNIGGIFPIYFGAQTVDSIGSKEEDSIRAMLINVNTALGDTAQVQKIIREADPDILVLEEISFQWMNNLDSITQFYPFTCVETREDNFGIGLFSKFPLANEKIVFIGEAGVPSVVATVRVPDQDLHVIGTHPLPPSGAEYSLARNDQLEKLADYINLHSLSSQPLLLLGDLNTTPWNTHFKKLLKQTGLMDSSQGRGVQPTWPSFMPLFWIPIDHCLHSSSVLVVDKTIGPNIGSDHYPVIVDFVIQKSSDDRDR